MANPHTKTAYFLGAGASKADRFPLTRELLGAVSARIFDAKGKRRNSGSELAEFLTTVFSVRLENLKSAARAWNSLVEAISGGKHCAARTPHEIPNLTDILSSLDILLSEESTIGAGRSSGRALKGSFLATARAQIVRAIAEGFRSLHDSTSNLDQLTVGRFVRALGTDDVIITTNWDILVDTARCMRFGATESDYGTDADLAGGEASRLKCWEDPALARLRNEGLESEIERPRKFPKRPKLLKLHGSLNWLHCPRCQRLRIDVKRVIAHCARSEGAAAGVEPCDCGVAFFESVLVTPTFVKSYRNRHLMNIWSTAQRELAGVSRWVFVGYSLPDDDIHIKTLLLKAKQMRADRGAELKIVVVDHRRDAQLEERYGRLLGECEFDFRGFERFVGRLERERRPVDKRRGKTRLQAALKRREDQSRRRVENARRRRKRRQLLKAAEKRA